jgi:hypothetical protein
MGVPEHRGGDGAGHLARVVMTEPGGRPPAPGPGAAAAAAPRLIARTPAPDGTSPEAARTALDTAIDGTSLTTLALQPARRGVPQLVPAAAVADAVVGLIDGDLVVARLLSPPRSVANQGHTPLAWCDIAGDDVERTVIATGDRAIAAYHEAIRDWKLLMAGALVGVADGALAIALTHAKERIAFGVPIGSFQAVAHPLVDVAMEVEVARRIAWKAAWWADTDPGVERQLVPMAYRYAESAAVHGTIVGVHTLGGVGVTVESDVQLYFRRTKGWTLVAGDPERELDHIADAMFGPARVDAQGVAS